MTQRGTTPVLEAFQLDYFKLQKRVFQVLKILHGDSYCLYRRSLGPGLLVIIIISLIFNVSYEFKREDIATYSLIFVGFSQVLLKSIVLNVYPKEIRELIAWIGAFHVDSTWMNSRHIVRERFQATLRYFKAVVKFVLVGDILTVQLMAFLYFFNGTLLFRIPFVSYLHENIQFFWQYIAMTYTIFYYASTEFINFFFGFYFVAILSIYINSIEKLDDENFVKSSRNHLKDYHHKHLQILQKLEDFVKIFSFILNAQAVSYLPLLINTFYNITIHPDIFINYLILCSIVTQLFEICLLGEFFDSKTTEIFRKLYLTKWYEMSRDDKMILVLMMRMTIKPFSLKAAGIYNINMMAFVDVIKFCISFCAILHAMT
uniref:Odorant receptor n=1 Tax=Phlebotomus papatasi TaxID=29031 RepID=A0A3F2ZEA0_PHLPP